MRFAVKEEDSLLGICKEGPNTEERWCPQSSPKSPYVCYALLA